MTAGPRSERSAGPEPLALVNGRIHTLDPQLPQAQALLIRDGRVAAVGSDRHILRERPPGCRVVDLGGRAVTPGLTDAHCHLLQYGFTLLAVDLYGVASLDELLRRVAAAAAGVPQGRWILGRGWDQDRLAEGRWPTRRDLDAVVPDRPVLLRRVCGHAAVANSRALELAGIDATTPDPADGRIDREAGGQPNGVLHEAAIRLVDRVIPAPDAATRRRALEAAIRRAHAAGLVGVHTQDVWDEGQVQEVLDLYRDVRQAGLPLRVDLLVGHRALDELLGLGLKTGHGDDFVRIGPVKLFADGSLGARTAALTEPYSDDPGNRGMLIHEPAELADLARRATAAGCQVAVHAIGDRAADVALDAFEHAAAGGLAVARRFRLIHCQIMRREQWERMRALGVIADIQPRFTATDQRWVERRVGRRRLAASYAWRSMVDAGITICAGSDAPVEPIEPALGLHAAVHRTDDEGEPAGGWLPGERVSPAEALRWFTRGAAYAAFAEGERGRLAPGFRADLVAWSHDPLQDDPAGLSSLRAALTVVGGRIVHSC